LLCHFHPASSGRFKTKEESVIDRLNINIYPVIVSPPSASSRGPVLQRIDVLEREATHLANAARQMRAAINSGQSRLLTEGVLNSRNWMLSVVMSHCFIQSALDAPGGSDSDRHGVWPKTATPNAFVVSEFLVQRAGRVGVEDGGRLRG
jgi:hypothetical protein